MTTQGLPPVAPDVTAGIVEALTPRLRKRLDAAITKLLACPIERDGDTVRVTVGEDAELTLSAPTGSVTSADDLRCTCLLAPACVHRAAAAAAAPIAEAAAGEVAAAAPTPDAGPAPVEPMPAGEAERAAADALWAAGAAIVDAGIDTAGAVLQATLLRAAHTARLAGLHRASAARWPA